MLFKILKTEEWDAAKAAGAFTGSSIDIKDGFIHLSAAHQVCDTASRHFGGEDALVLVAFPEVRLVGLKWETSRGGDLFPHVYGAIPTSAAGWEEALPLVNGVHRFPARTGL